jgi:hypothetical protein
MSARRPIGRPLALAVLLLGASACPRRSAPPPPPDADPNVQLHVEHAIGVPVVDIRREPDAGTTRIQIGGASVHLPTREPDPPSAE